jgi:hypothetical protein
MHTRAFKQNLSQGFVLQATQMTEFAPEAVQWEHAASKYNGDITITQYHFPDESELARWQGQ